MVGPNVDVIYAPKLAAAFRPPTTNSTRIYDLELYMPTTQEQQALASRAHFL